MPEAEWYRSARTGVQFRPPPGWDIKEHASGSIEAASPDGQFLFRIARSDLTAEAFDQRERTYATPNYYLVQQTTWDIGGAKIPTYEFVDTISGTREIRMILPGPPQSYELEFRQSGGAGSRYPVTGFEIIRSSLKRIPQAISQ